MNERLKTHSKTQKKSADLVSNKLRIGVFQRYQMKCKSVSKKSPRYSEQLYLNELGYVYGNEEKTNEIVKKHPGYVIKIFEEKMGNELKIRTRMMKILRNGKINIYEYMNI